MSSSASIMVSCFWSRWVNLYAPDMVNGAQRNGPVPNLWSSLPFNRSFALPPSRLRGEPWVGLAAAIKGGKNPAVPGRKTRNTPRTRKLRREATAAERAVWQHLSRSQQGAKFSR